MSDNPSNRTNVIGGAEVGTAITVELDQNAIHKTNSLFWDSKGNDILGTTALPLYGTFISEEKCKLFGNVSGKKVLEIGCGSGQSLHYLGMRNASELWGIDISENQIEKTKQHLASSGIFAHLVCSPYLCKCFSQGWLCY